MITVDGIRKQAERAYPSFLRSLVSEEPFFPLDIRFGKGIPKGGFHDFSASREALLKKARAYVVELKRHNSRRYGPQMLPARIYFDDRDAYVGFVGKTEEVLRFRGAIACARESLPELMPWLERNVVRIAGHVDGWEDLLTVCRYFLEHPRPDCYARELPLPIHTKFVEEHEALLRQMLDFLLPAEAIDAGASSFARRFGLRYEEPQLRIRVLDPNLSHTSGWPSDDLSLSVSALARLRFEACTVVISENKMTFLTLPHVRDALALWGGGFGMELLRDLEWLRACTVYYWGDLDAHGFIILSRLRSFLPAVTSLMMDVDTFETFRAYAVAGTPTREGPLPNLTPEEQGAYQSLAAANLRLEQEHIAQSYVMRCLEEDVVDPAPPF